MFFSLSLSLYIDIYIYIIYIYINKYIYIYKYVTHLFIYCLFFSQNLDFPSYLAKHLKHCHLGGQWTVAWLHGSHHSSSSPLTTHTSARGCLRIGPKIWMKPATYSPAEEMSMFWALLPISGLLNKIIHLHPKF